ncbi:unnamed protein product, partial [Mesorhabditis spiculigera]
MKLPGRILSELPVQAQWELFQERLLAEQQRRPVNYQRLAHLKLTPRQIEANNALVAGVVQKKFGFRS